MKRFFETRREAEKERKRLIAAGRRNTRIWDLKRSHPERKKRRFLVGDRFDWLAQ